MSGLGDAWKQTWNKMSAITGRTFQSGGPSYGPLEQTHKAGLPFPKEETKIPDVGKTEQVLESLGEEERLGVSPEDIEKMGPTDEKPKSLTGIIGKLPIVLVVGSALLLFYLIFGR